MNSCKSSKPSLATGSIALWRGTAMSSTVVVVTAAYAGMKRSMRTHRTMRARHPEVA